MVYIPWSKILRFVRPRISVTNHGDITVSHRKNVSPSLIAELSNFNASNNIASLISSLLLDTFCDWSMESPYQQMIPHWWNLPLDPDLSRACPLWPVPLSVIKRQKPPQHVRPCQLNFTASNLITSWLWSNCSPSHCTIIYRICPVVVVSRGLLVTKELIPGRERDHIILCSANFVSWPVI